MNRLRIVHVVESLGPWGTQRALTRVARHLPAAEFEQAVIAARPGSLTEEFVDQGISVETVGRACAPSFAAAWRAYRAVRRQEADVVHLWDEWARRFVGPPLVLRGGVSLVCALRNPPRGLDWGRRTVDRIVLARSEVVLANDPLVLEKLLYAYGLKLPQPRRYCVIDDVVVDDPAQPSQFAPREETLAAFGLPPSTLLIGTASELTQTKNLRDLIFACALLRLARDDFRLVVVGDGPGTTAACRFNTRMRMDDLTIFTGERRDMDRLLQHFDVYVDCAASDGPTRGIAEAQAHGVPVVCVDSPIRRWQVQPDVDALLFPANDPGALTRQLYLLLGDEALRERLGRAARTAAQRRPTSQSIVAQYADCYRAAVRDRTGR